MPKNALEALLEQRQLHSYVSFFEVEYGGYTIYYAGAYFGLIYETAKGDVEEREFCWDSFEEMYDCYIKEVGKTWREVLEATPADKIDMLF